jgi:hypothetical protein
LIFGYISNSQRLNAIVVDTSNEFITQTVDINTNVDTNSFQEIENDIPVCEIQLKQLNVYAEWSTSYELDSNIFI